MVMVHLFGVNSVGAIRTTLSIQPALLIRQAALFAAGALLLVAGLRAQTSTVDLKGPAVIARGSDLYAKNCAVGYCHGSEGRPARGPDLRNQNYEPQVLFGMINDGIPNTTMPPWKSLLSPVEIWSVTAYVLSLSSDSQGLPDAKVKVEGARAANVELSAEGKRGHELFFDLTRQKRCGVCHRLGGEGSSVGPDLALSAASKTAEELRRDIVEPGASIAAGFETTVVVTKSGDRARGVKQEQTSSFVKLYDTTSIPPPLRTFYQDDIESVVSEPASPMPEGLDRAYSDEDLDAIIAYLKSFAP